MSMTFDEFAGFVLTQVGIEGELPVRPDDRLIEDLGFDSLALLVFHAVLEELCGVPVEPELVESSRTIGEAFGWYQTVCGRIGEGDAVCGRLDVLTAPPWIDTSDGSQPPPMSGRHCRIEPLDIDAYGWLSRLWHRGDVAWRWRDRGIFFRPEEWLERIWADVVLQFVVRPVRGHERIGLVTIYGHDPLARHARVAALFDDTCSAAGTRLEGAVLALGYAFETLGLRKVYAEIPEFNLRHFRSGAGRWFRLEGSLLDYHWAAGRLWTMYVASIDRPRFSELWNLVLASRPGQSKEEYPADDATTAL